MGTRAIAWLLAALIVAAPLAGLAVDRGLDEHRIGTAPILGGLAVVALVAGLGLLVVERSPGRRIGLLLLGFTALLTLGFLSMGVTAGVLLEDGRDPWWARFLLYLTQASWVPLFGTVVALAFVFPTGRCLTRRWRWVLGGCAAVWSALFLTLLTSGEPAIEPYGDVAPPFGTPSWLFDGLFATLWPLTIASLPLAAVALVVRYRRSGGPERKQLQWLLLAVGLLPLAFAAGGLSEVVDGQAAEWVGHGVFLAFVLAVPVAVAVALTRYRLYEIDWIVNRTLVYASLTAVLAGAWVGIALGLGLLAGGGSPWIAALATAVVALAFSPLRVRVQGLVDRRFARARFEAVHRLRAFEDAVREGRARPESVGGVLREALGDPSATLALRLSDAGELVELPGGVPTADAQARTPVVRDGQEIAVLAHAPELLHRPHLVRAALGTASLTIELARLQVQLRRQLAEVEVSRARIVQAGDDERRRLERDLHDGAQQRLVGLGIRLRRIQRSLPKSARVLVPALDDAVAEVGRAIADLRTIAAGLRPPSLDDGLAAALSELARSTPIPVDVAATRERLPAPIEAAAYFVACEAVTNAVKHGSPSSIRIDAARQDGAVRLVVADDGVGGAAARPGSGLAGLADRLDAHGGTLLVDSRPGGGTRVEAVIPCAS